MHCPRCQSELLPNAKFCRKCGTPVKVANSTELITASGLDKSAQSTATTPVLINCPKCATPHNPTERFCENCNHDFSPRTTLISAPPDIPQPVITGERLSQPTLPQTAAVYPQVSTPIQRKRSPVVAILVALIVLMAAGGTIGYFYLQNQKVQDAAKPSSNPYPTSEIPPPQTQTSNSATVKPPEPKTKPVENPPSKTDVTGRWTTADNDIIDLKQNGTTVTGTYKGGATFKGMTGNLKGTFDGKNFVGAYLHHIGNYQIRGKLRVAMTDGGQLVGTWIASDGNSGAYVLTRAKS